MRSNVMVRYRVEAGWCGRYRPEWPGQKDSRATVPGRQQDTAGKVAGITKPEQNTPRPSGNGFGETRF
ncbi:MAG: hypothetical protein ACP5PK_06470 [candidate division WOR-3 bacterium]